MVTLIRGIGSRVVYYIDYVGAIGKLFFNSLYWTFVPPLKRERILVQARNIGLESLPIVSGA